LLGGRVAEAIVLGDISTGAQNDLERATSIVRRMIMEYGMSDELGPLTLGRKTEQVFLGRDIARDRNYSEEVAFAIDKEVRKIIDASYNKAKELLEQNIDKLHLIAGSLMEKETLEADEFTALMEGKTVEEVKAEKKAREEAANGNGKTVDGNGKTGNGEAQPARDAAPEEDGAKIEAAPDAVEEAHVSEPREDDTK
ncbi:MAG: hypothetical protein ACOY4Q_12810, partial [Bacillota bacterium]